MPRINEITRTKPGVFLDCDCETCSLRGLPLVSSADGERGAPPMVDGLIL